MRIIPFIACILIACNPDKSESPETTNENCFVSLRQNDIKLKDPQPGEWRYFYNDSHQSFEDYKRVNPKRAVLGKTKIYLQPIGEFSTEQCKILESVREYLEIFFQLATVILKPLPGSVIPDSAARTKVDRPIQWHTPFILNKLLKGNIPADGYALMAISEKDIYPGPGWNFVFGIASYADRVGVTSVFRLQSSVPDSSIDLLCLKRLFSISSHEIGHMFSMRHCVFASCAMNGSNSLDETDRCTSRLCSECQQKLHWNIGYDNRKRLKALVAYFKKHNLPEDLALAEKDYKLLQ